MKTNNNDTKNMINLTEMEAQIMQDITKDDFYEDGVDSQIWADNFISSTCSIESNKARGVLASLVKKDLIYGIEKGREGTIAFTELGKEYMTTK